MAKEDGMYEDLTYKDSWLQNTVELAALGTIVAGAGSIAVSGDFDKVINAGKKAGGALGKGFENFVKRKGGNPLARFGLQTGISTVKQLKRFPAQTKTKDVSMDGLADRIRNSVDDFQKDEFIQRKVNEETARRLSLQQSLNKINKDVHKKETYPPKSANEIYDEVWTIERDKYLDPQPKKKSFGFQQDKPLSNTLNKKEIGANMVAHGLAGMAMGGGISAFHGVERMLSDKKDNKKMEDSFHYAGSFLPQKKEEHMKKSASSNQTLKNLGMKLPESIVQGVGFTGVSLGAAKVLNDKKQKEEEKSNKNTRVIIELGNNEGIDMNNLAAPPATKLGSLPKLASISSDLLGKQSTEKGLNLAKIMAQRYGG